jgi:hypothetical protein
MTVAVRTETRLRFYLERLLYTGLLLSLIIIGTQRRFEAPNMRAGPFELLHES